MLTSVVGRGFTVCPVSSQAMVGLTHLAGIH
jgi:hypothetical protein